MDTPKANGDHPAEPETHPKVVYEAVTGEVRQGPYGDYAPLTFRRVELGSVAANGAEVQVETNGDKKPQRYAGIPDELSKIYEDLYGTPR